MPSFNFFANIWIKLNIHSFHSFCDFKVNDFEWFAFKNENSLYFCCSHLACVPIVRSDACGIYLIRYFTDFHSNIKNSSRERKIPFYFDPSLTLFVRFDIKTNRASSRSSQLCTILFSSLHCICSKSTSGKCHNLYCHWECCFCFCQQTQQNRVRQQSWHFFSFSDHLVQT